MRVILLAVAAAVAGLVLGLVLAVGHRPAPDLHYAPCPGQSRSWQRELPAPLPSCLYLGG